MIDYRVECYTNIIQIHKQLIGWCEPSCWVQSCQFHSSRSLLSAMSHSAYMLTCIHHMPPLCNRLSSRFRWFSLNGLLFILFGFFINLPYKTDVSPLDEFHSARSSSLITVLHHTTECIYTLYTCTLCYSSLTGYLRVFNGSVWWPSFYTLCFLHQLNIINFNINFSKLQFSGICYRPLCLLHRILL